MTDVIRSVLFVDFDNVFFSLQSADKAAAKSFADDPGRWLDAIESGALIENMPGAPFEGRRRILMRRCYANPAVMRYFRSYFTRSGFQIVDCPPLTGRGKNSADIYMVVDMLDALKHETRFDEFIILSGDADFTPVLLRLRAYDRSSIIYSNAVTASAYKSLCDGMITEERLIDLASIESDLDDAQSTNATASSLSPAGMTYYPNGQSTAQPNGVPIGRGGDRFPDKGIDRIAESVPDAGHDRSPERNRPQDRRRTPVKPLPEPAETASLVDHIGRPVKIAPELAPLARRVNAATNVPMFASDIYAALFRTIANDVRETGFSFNRTVNAVIRRLGDMGLKLRPQHVAFVVKGLMLSGHEFVDTDTPETLAKGFRRQVLYLCASEDMNLSDTERSAIGMWIVGGLKNLSESEILASEPIPSDASVAAEVAGVDLDTRREEDLDLKAPDTEEPPHFELSDGQEGSDSDRPDEEALLSDGAADPDVGDHLARETGDAAEPVIPAREPRDIGGILARIRSSGRS
jgi:hypothetical protein